MTTTTSSISNVQPVAALQPKDAEIKLFKTNIDVLWFETVLKAAWYEKPFALISYLWNRSEAAVKDVKSGKTVELLNNKMTALVEAVAKRTLSSEETTKAGIAGLQFSSEGAQNDSLERQLAVKKAEEEFYDVFRTRCQQLEIDPNHKDFGALVLAVQNKLQKASKNEELLKKFNISSEHMRLKVDTVCKDVSVRVFDHVLTTSISDEIAHLTPDSFKKAVALLKKYVPNNSDEKIEEQVRGLILKKFSPQALVERSQEFLTTKHAEKVAAAKAELVKVYTEKEESILAELNVLRGTNGDNGTVHTTYLAANAAKLELDTATTAYKAKYAEALHVDVNSLTNTSVEALIKLTHLPASLDPVKTQFIAAKEKFSAADKAHQKLAARLNESVRFAGDEKVALNTRRLHLCGPNGGDGAIDQAYQLIAPALAALTAAEIAFRAAFDTSVGTIEAARAATVPVSTLVEMPNLATALTQVKADYLAAKANHDTLSKAKSTLDVELANVTSRLAVINPLPDGEFVGGELVKVRNAKTDAASTAEAVTRTNGTGNFLAEISTPVKDGEGATRFTALHRIIG
jgi:hypothetical protein